MLPACSVPLLPQPKELSCGTELLTDTRAWAVTLPGAQPLRWVLQLRTLPRAHMRRAGKDLV